MRYILKRILNKNIRISNRLLRLLNKNVNLVEDGTYRIGLKAFLETFQDSLRGKKVLDLGAGTWTWTKDTFSDICSITTFDVAAHQNVEVVGDVYNLSDIFANSPKFDAVLATDLFEHLPDIPTALAQVNQVLVPGGLLVLSTPFKKEMHGEEYGDYWRITRQGWKDLLAKAGMENIRIDWVGDELFPIAFLVSATKKYEN